MELALRAIELAFKGIFVFFLCAGLLNEYTGFFGKWQKFFSRMYLIVLWIGIIWMLIRHFN
jgi:hypothetical protein